MFLLPRDNKFPHRFLSMTGVYDGIDSFLFLKVCKGDSTSPKQGEPTYRKKYNLYLILHHHQHLTTSYWDSETPMYSGQAVNILNVKISHMSLQCRKSLRSHGVKEHQQGGLTHTFPSILFLKKNSRHWIPSPLLLNSSSINCSQYVFKGPKTTQGTVKGKEECVRGKEECVKVVWIKTESQMLRKLWQIEPVKATKRRSSCLYAW